MQKTNYFLIAIGIVLVYLTFKVHRSPRIAYVKSSEVIYGYLGMKDAQRKQAAEEEKLKSHIDSLKFALERDITEYNAVYASLSKEEQLHRKELLSRREGSYREYSKSIQEKIKRSDENLTAGVLNQINAFVEEYGTQQGYDLVLGTTTSGNILFAKGYLDMTSDVLQELNKSYKPGTQTN